MCGHHRRMRMREGGGAVEEQEIGRNLNPSYAVIESQFLNKLAIFYLLYSSYYVHISKD
jgi:hypothetical protein